MSDPTQSPSPGEPPDADDAPAAVGPDEPTLAHPVTGDAATADLSGAAGFPSAEPAPEAAIPVPPPEPDAPPPPAVPGDPVPHSEPLPAAPPVSAAPDSAPVSPPPPPPPVAPVPPPPVAPVLPPPVTPLGADDAGGSGGPAAAVMAAAQERPELAVGASFAGGLVLAMILKRLAR